MYIWVVIVSFKYVKLSFDKGNIQFFREGELGEIWFSHGNCCMAVTILHS